MQVAFVKPWTGALGAHYMVGDKAHLTPGEARTAIEGGFARELTAKEMEPLARRTKAVPGVAEPLMIKAPTPRPAASIEDAAPVIADAQERRHGRKGR